MRRAVPIYTPEDAAKVLWSLILTERALLEHFDMPPPGYEGDPKTFRNLAREYPGMRDDPRVQKIVAHYYEHSGVQRGEGKFPNEFTRPQPEPGVELDGVTIITNATDPDDLPF